MMNSGLLSIREEVGNPTKQTERYLLLLAGLFLLVNWLALSLIREQALTHTLHLCAWLLSAIIGHRFLERYLPKRDPFIFPIAMFLSGWGILAIDRLAPIFADRQSLWLMLAVGVMLLTAIFPNVLSWLRQYRYLLLISGLVLLVSTIFFGRNPSGLSGAPQLWLGIGNIFFQPSEALKIILVTFLATYLGEQYPSLRAGTLFQEANRLFLSPRILGPILLMWGLSMILLVWQRDLGTAILFFGVFITLLYVASGTRWILLGGSLLVLIAGFLAYQLFAVVQLRVDIWINPWLEADGRAFQIVQSLMAFSSGGVFGQGVAQGSPTYIPVVHSDFVFSAIGEEWGLIGIFTLLACFAILTMRGLRIATLHQGRLVNALLAIGLTLLIALQSLLIMAGVMKLIPLTGVTLPFVSYGGSSLLISFIIVGLLLRLSSRDS